MKQKISRFVYVKDIIFKYFCTNKPSNMKRISILLLLLAFVFGQSAKAQEDKDFRFTIKTNPLAALGGPLWVAFVPITGEYKILFEARTAKRQSIETGISYLGPSVLINLDELSEGDSVSGVKTSGFRVQFMYKFFLTKDQAPEGFYVGPHFSYARATLENKDNPGDKLTASKLNVNVILGYQLITKGGFALNMYTGLGYKMRDYDYAEESDFGFDTGNSAVPNVAFGFTFGYAF